MVGDRAFLRIWTFESSNRLIEVLRRLAPVQVVSLEDFRSSSRRGRVTLTELDSMEFVSLHAKYEGEHSTPAFEASLEVSPFDPRFPRFDWSAELPRDRTRHRRSVASRVVSRYLRGIIEYPTVLTLEMVVSFASSEGFFRSFYERVPAMLDDIDGLVGVGLISRSGAVLPPESLSWQMEQVSELRCKFDRRYPFSFCSGESFWVSDQGLTEEIENPDFPAEKLIAPMGDKEYRDFLRQRGVFELPDGALLAGNREGHPLHGVATEILTATGRALCPLSSDEIDRGLHFDPSRRPHLLLPVERCAVLTSRVNTFSWRASDSRSAIGNQLIRSLQGEDSAISDDVANVLRSLWELSA